VRILVTGATGFIGSAFVQRAATAGHSIGAMVRHLDAAVAQLGHLPNVTFLAGSLAAPPWDAITAFAPETCLHSAWIATPGVYLESPANTEYAQWTVEFAKGLRDQGLRHFVGLGTCIEYDTRSASRALIEDETPLHPTSLYARMKNTTRAALADELDHSATTFAWARIFFPYGPDEHPQRLCSSLIRQLRKGETARLQRPSNTNDYIFIDDVAAGLLAIIEQKAEGPVNVGTGSGVTVAELAHTIRNLLQERGDIVGQIEEAQNAPADYIVADATRLRSAGWSPRFSLPKGLELMLNAGKHTTAP